ncbi:MAG: phosphonoacetaldehyde hydrolase [Polyangiaceae bacterium]
MQTSLSAARRAYQDASPPTHTHVEAVVFDWAGTTVDHGCLAPVASFIEVFRRRGVDITVEEARAPMGTQKRTHIEMLTKMAPIAERWQSVHGRSPTSEDVDAMFRDFLPLQLACLADRAEPIDGLLETVGALRRRHIKIGSTTGFTREMMDVLLPAAKAHGYCPDAVVTPTDVPAGRPYPFMCLKNAIDLGVTSVSTCIKVDDTTVGIEEGLNAGMWTVGVAATGNELGLTKEEFATLDPLVRSALIARARTRLRAAGAHHVIDSVSDFLIALEDIETRLSVGERP